MQQLIALDLPDKIGTEQVTGNDLINGGAGNDNIFGGAGNDTLYGDSSQFANVNIPSQNTFVYNGNTYFLTSATTWEHAQTEAQNSGGNLVTINNAAEQHWLRETFGGHNDLWIGLTDKIHEGNFQWASGETVTYTNWAHGEPNNLFNEDYAAMNFEDANQWNDWRGHKHFQGIVEVTGVVPKGNDFLVGGQGDDNLNGGLGNDTLNGTNASEMGFNEKDVLVGGGNGDTFILGDKNSAYYIGDLDNGYATIEDFNINEDTIQLKDNTNYYLGNSNNDSHLYAFDDSAHRWDKVAVLENTHLDSHDLGNSAFEYV